MKKCSCGKEWDDSTHFCAFCGSKLDDSQAQTEPMESEQTAQPEAVATEQTVEETSEAVPTESVEETATAEEVASEESISEEVGVEEQKPNEAVAEQETEPKQFVRIESPQGGYNQAPPNQPYNQAPPNQVYNQAPPNQVYNQAPPNQAYNQVPPQNNYQQPYGQQNQGGRGWQGSGGQMPPFSQNYAQQGNYQDPNAKPESIVAGAIGLGLAIFALVMAFTMVIPFTLGVAGVILGIVQVVRSKRKGLGIAAIAVGAVSLLLAFFTIIMISFSTNEYNRAYGSRSHIFSDNYAEGRVYDYDDDYDYDYDNDYDYDYDDDRYYGAEDGSNYDSGKEYFYNHNGYNEWYQNDELYQYTFYTVSESFGTYDIPEQWEVDQLNSTDYATTFVASGGSNPRYSSVTVQMNDGHSAVSDMDTYERSIRDGLKANADIRDIDIDWKAVKNDPVLCFSYEKHVEGRGWADVDEYHILYTDGALVVTSTEYPDNVPAEDVAEHIVGTFEKAD